jgi:hypothetical protein
VTHSLYELTAREDTLFLTVTCRVMSLHVLVDVSASPPLLQYHHDISDLNVQGDARYLKDIEQFYSTQIDEMPSDVANLI